VPDPRVRHRLRLPGRGAGAGARKPVALESRAGWRPIAVRDTGWWVDEAIRTVPLPTLPVGVHRLSLQTDFTRTSAIEWVYLLGNFSVPSTAPDAALGMPVTALHWGDWTTQGLPFYAGNITYRLPLDMIRQETLQVRLRRSPTRRCALPVDERDAGLIAFAPFECSLGEVLAGHHELRLTAFGTPVQCIWISALSVGGEERHRSQLLDTSGGQWDYDRHV